MVVVGVLDDSCERKKNERNYVCEKAKAIKYYNNFGPLSQTVNKQ